MEVNIMGMKPRIEPLVNKKLDEKLCTEPSEAQGPEDYRRLEPFTVTERENKGNEAIPGVVTQPRRHA
jgi:hypothetical protein